MEPIKDSSVEFKIDRLPKDLQEQFRRLYDETGSDVEYLRPNAVYQIER